MDVVYKIRGKTSRLFKVKRPPGFGSGGKWNEVGDTYATLGIARSALKAMVRATNFPIDEFEIVVFKLREITVVGP